MTLQEVITLIEKVASHQPSIKMVVENDVFRLNGKADARYGVFAWLQGQHSGSIDGAFMRYQFTFFYVDRLKADLSNQIEVQSVGIATLDNMLRDLNESGVYVDTYNFTTFNQRFVDECAGVFCSVAIDAPISGVCAEKYADFNDDFNNDFLIY